MGYPSNIFDEEESKPLPGPFLAKNGIEIDIDKSPIAIYPHVESEMAAMETDIKVADGLNTYVEDQLNKGVSPEVLQPVMESISVILKPYKNLYGSFAVEEFTLEDIREDEGNFFVRMVIAGWRKLMEILRSVGSFIKKFFVSSDKTNEKISEVREEMKKEVTAKLSNRTNATASNSSTSTKPSPVVNKPSGKVNTVLGDMLFIRNGSSREEVLNALETSFENSIRMVHELNKVMDRFSDDIINSTLQGFINGVIQNGIDESLYESFESHLQSLFSNVGSMFSQPADKPYQLNGLNPNISSKMVKANGLMGEGLHIPYSMEIYYVQTSKPGLNVFWMSSINKHRERPLESIELTDVERLLQKSEQLSSVLSLFNDRVSNSDFSEVRIKKLLSPDFIRRVGVGIQDSEGNQELIDKFKGIDSLVRTIFDNEMRFKSHICTNFSNNLNSFQKEFLNYVSDKVFEE